MSTIRVTNIDPPSAGGAVNVNGVAMPNVGPLSNRNLIINGAMQVAQRSTSVASLGNNDSGYHTVDRFRFTEGGTHTFQLTMAQSTDAPTGFSNSLRFDTTTAQASPNASDQLRVEYRLEGQDLQHLDYGTASAKTFTLSFWVKSNVEADYVVWFRNISNTASCRHVYTINSADTWEYKTITVSGDTANAFTNDNSIGMTLSWLLSAGSDFTSGTPSETWVSSDTNANRYVGQTANIVASTDNDWSITGVQLELGDQETPFEHRSYGDELAKCLRYYNSVGDFTLRGTATRYWAVPIGLSSTLRDSTAATLTYTTTDGGSAVTNNHTNASNVTSSNHITIGAQFTTSGGSTGRCTFSDIVVSNEL